MEHGGGNGGRWYFDKCPGQTEVSELHFLGSKAPLKGVSLCCDLIVCFLLLVWVLGVWKHCQRWNGRSDRWRKGSQLADCCRGRWWRLKLRQRGWDGENRSNAKELKLIKVCLFIRFQKWGKGGAQESTKFGTGELEWEVCTKDEECRKVLFSECFLTVEFFVCWDYSLRKLNYSLRCEQCTK